MTDLAHGADDIGGRFGRLGLRVLLIMILASPVAVGIILGLVLGKPVGIACGLKNSGIGNGVEEWGKARLVVEPGGAAALAALLAGKVAAEEGMLILLSGGNVDRAAYARVLAG